MMNTFLAIFVLMSLALVGMSVGVLMGGKRLRGSCGGLSAATTNDEGEKVCGICGQGVASCETSESRGGMTT